MIVLPSSCARMSCSPRIIPCPSAKPTSKSDRLVFAGLKVSVSCMIPPTATSGRRVWAETIRAGARNSTKYFILCVVYPTEAGSAVCTRVGGGLDPPQVPKQSHDWLSFDFSSFSSNSVWLLRATPSLVFGRPRTLRRRRELVGCRGRARSLLMPDSMQTGPRKGANRAQGYHYYP